MPVTNNNKAQVDVPVFEWMRFLPAATPALSAMSAVEIPGERYFYVISGATFWRYDTVTDTFTQLASPPTAALTAVAMKFSPYGRYVGRVLSAPSSTTLEIPGLQANRLNGETIRIMSGTGQGQERTILSSAEPIIKDHGVCTTAAAASITDNVKKWNFNQWKGYQCKLVYGTGQTQYRKILYNDATNLYFYDVNWQQHFAQGNTGFSATAPYALPVSAAGTQTNYTIESQIITVNTAYSPTPDSLSWFQIHSGAILLVSSAAATPFYTYQVYDILSDTWSTRSAIGGLLTAALGTDIAIERTGEIAGIYDTGTASSGTARTIVDSTKTWTVDQYCNFEVFISSGTGIGQGRRIIANSPTTLTVNRAFDTTPDNTSVYKIYANRDAEYLVGNASPAIYQHFEDSDNWTQGSVFGFGIARQMAVQTGGMEAYGVTSGARNVTGVTAISATPQTAGTGYSVGDILTLTTTGTNGKVIVTGTTTAGAISSLALVACGSGYSAGTSATSGGTGSAGAVTISTVGTVGLVTTAMSHAIKIGESVKFTGDTLWAGTYTVLGVPSLTTLEFAITAAGAATAAQAQTTAIIADSSQAWTPGEHIGKIIQVSAAGQAGAATLRRITANTATTITVSPVMGAAATNGTSRYIIHDVKPFGRAVQYKNPTLSATGYATGGSLTTLIDTTKNWIGNQWAGYKFRVVSGTGFDKNEITITSNTPTTLTYSSAGFTPDATTKYEIMDTYGLVTAITNTTNAVLTDSTKLWQTNMWAGKRLRIVAGDGAGQEIAITGNTTTAITCVGVFTTIPVVNSSVYAIMDPPARGAGTSIQWLSNSTTNPGRYFLIPRGGNSNVIDRYDITTELYDLTFTMMPQSELFTTGTMWCYDGKDRIFVQVNATGRIYALNTVTGTIEGAGQVTYGMGAALIGARMDIIQTIDGLKYLYILQHTGAAAGTPMWRQLLFW
jgi:hypothetical protein